MPIITTENPTGGVVSLHVEDPALIAHLKGLVAKGDLVSVDVEGDGSYQDRTVSDLRAEIDTRNEDRDDEDLIVPDGTKKADLVAALEADDAEG